MRRRRAFPSAPQSARLVLGGITWVGDDAVADVLDPRSARDVVHAAFVAFAAGDVQMPVRSVLAAGAGWFAVMPAFVAGTALALGAKLVSAFPANADRGDRTHHALVVLVDAETGAPRAVVAGETITERRTAAASLLATERLAARPHGTLALLGSGVQAHAHLDAFVAAGLAPRVRVWSRAPQRAEGLAARARGLGRAAVPCATATEALAGADVIVTATASAEPLFEADAVADGAHVCAVGACVPDRREVPAALVAEALRVVDSRDGAAREAGDLLLAERDLGRPLPPYAELGALLAEPHRVLPFARVTLFESLGLGALDVACAAHVFERVEARSRA